VIACLLLCAAVGAGAQSIQANKIQPQPGTPVVTPLTPLQKERDDFQTAIVKDDLGAIRAFIKSGRKLDFNFDEEAPRQRTSESPVTMAVNRNKLPVLRLLLEGGASASRADGFGRPPIQLAKSAEVARILTAAGADPNAQNYRGYTGLAEAVWNGNLAAIDALLAVGARFDAPSKSDDVFTIAVQMRKTELIPALVERGADPRRPPTKVLPALIDAGDTASVVALLRAGADPNAQNQYAPVLLVALFRKQWQIADALLDAGANVNLADPADCKNGYGCWSIQAARSASFEPAVLKKLAARGLDLDKVATNGQTALTSLIVEQVYAVRAVNASGTANDIPAPDNVARVRNLLQAGADPNRKSGEHTPLMIAMTREGAFADVIFDAGGRVEIAQTIPADAEGPVPTASAPGRRTDMRDAYLNYRGVNTGMKVGPLTWTVFNRRGDLAVRMLQREGRIDAADQHLLYWAGFFGEWDVVLRALPYKPDVDAGDRAGVTPLMLAAYDGRADAVRALLAAGAKMNARSVRTWPPLFERNLKEELGGAIAGHSPAPPRLVGGYTALRTAKERGHAEAARLIEAAGGRE
jgi:ankyrin repeat protein